MRADQNLLRPDPKESHQFWRVRYSFLFNLLRPLETRFGQVGPFRTKLFSRHSANSAPVHDVHQIFVADLSSAVGFTQVK